MQTKVGVQRRPKVAATTQIAHLAFLSFPVEVLAMTFLLTLGAVVHTYPQAFAPVLRYAHGIAAAAIEWHNTPMPSFYAQPTGQVSQQGR